MSRFKLAAAFVPLLVIVASAAPAPTPVNPAQAVALPVPAKAMVVVQVNGIDTVKKRLETVVKTAAPDVAEKLTKQFEEALNDAAGRDLKAITPGARLFAVIPDFEFGPDGPPLVVFFPVKDFDTFKAKLLTDDERKSLKKPEDGISAYEAESGTRYVLELAGKGYVAVSQNKSALEPLAGKYETLSANRMGATIADAFLSSDVSVYVNMDQVNDQYGDKIRQFRQLFQVLLQQAGGMGVPGVDAKQMKMIGEMYDGLFQAAEDSRGFAMGVEFRPTGVNLRIQSTFATGTDTAKALAQESPQTTEALNGAPGGFTTYVAGRVGPKITASMMKMAEEYAAGENNEKAKELVEKYNELAATAAGGGFFQAADVPNVSLEVTNASDGKALIAAQLALLKSLEAGGIFSNVPLKEKPTVKADAQKLGGFSFHEATLVLDFEAAVKNIPDENLRDTTIASMKKMAKEKTTIWFGTDGKRVIQVAAADWTAASKLIQDYLDGKNTIKTDKQFQLARAELPAETGIIVLVDMTKLTTMMGDLFGDIAKSIPGLPFGDLPKLKPSNDPAAFLGFSMGLKPTDVRIDVFVPAEGIKSTRKILMPILEKVEDQ